MLYSQDSRFRPLTSCGGGYTDIICLVRWQVLKPVSGYNGRYFISNTGVLYSGYPLKVRRFYNDCRGYERVDLHMHGRRKKVYVHRLVYETFVEKLEDGFEVDHHNCDRTFNKLYNLRKMSRKENMKKMLEQNPHILKNLKQPRLST